MDSRIRSSDESLEFIARSVKGILWQADAVTFEFSYVSPQSESILGYKPEEWYNNTSFWKDHIHPEDREQAVMFCHQKTQRGENHEFEYRMIRADGNIVWLKDVVTVHQTEKGEPVLTGLMIDITESKQLSVQEKDILIKSYQLADIGHWHIDLQSDTLFWSNEVREIFEVPEDFKPDLESAITFFEEGKHRENIRCVVTDAIEKGDPYKVEAKVITAKGQIKWVRTFGDVKKENGEVAILYGSIQDVTSIREYEDELVKLSRVARETQNVVIMTDPNDHITWVNKAFERVTGYTLEEVLGKNPGDLLQGAETDPEIIDRIRTNLSNELPFTERILNYSKDRTPYWNQMTVTPIKNSAGEVVEFFSIQEVVTNQVVAQKEIEKQTRRLKEAQEIASVGDWSYDIRTGQITWSEAVYSIFERDKELPPPSYTEITTLYKTDEFTSLVETALENAERYEEDFEIETYKGNTKYIKTIGIPVTDEDGTVTELRGIVQDITEKTKAITDLQYKEEQLTSIANNMQGILLRYVYHADKTGDIVFASEGIRDLHEISPEAVIKRPAKMWAQVLKEDLERVKNSIMRSSQDLSYWDATWRIKTPSGQLKWIQGRGNPVELENGSVRWDALITDVTRQVTSERNNKVLLQEVHHRVKNNLAIISGLLTLEMHEFENDRAKLSFQRSITRIHSMAKVHELLYDTDDHSSIRIGKYLSQLSDIILSTFTDEDRITVDVQTNEIDLNINVAIPLGMLMNELMTNSVKYAFKENKGAISIHIEQTGNEYMVKYQDTGPGMSEKPDLDDSKTLGFTIIHTLLKQLNSTYEVDVNGKFEMVLHFKKKIRGSHSNL